MRLADVIIPDTFDKIDPATGKLCVKWGVSSYCGQIDTFNELVSILLPNILVLAGVIFFLLILGGGFMMISGAGKESSPQDKAKAQGAITYGVIGFLLVISAFFILQIIGVITGVNFITPPTL